MSRELRRIQRLRDLKGHRERAAERELAGARRGVIELEQQIQEHRDAFTKAADQTMRTETTTAPDFEMERLYVLSLSRHVDRAEIRLNQGRAQVAVRVSELHMAHREVEQIERWGEITRTALRADELRLDRFESDEIAARISNKS